MSNGFGTGILFGSSNISTTATTGSILSFKIKKTANKKEVADGADQFAYVGFTQRKKTANAEVLFKGASVTLPEIGDTATVTNTWSGDVTGTWYVTDSEVNYKSDDAVKCAVELTMWYSGSVALS